MLCQIPSDVQQTHAELAGPEAKAAGRVLNKNWNYTCFSTD